MFLIVAILWILGLPVAIVLLIMVKAACIYHGIVTNILCNCVYILALYTHTDLHIFFVWCR